MKHETTRDFPTNTQIRQSNNINFKIVIPSTRNKTVVIGQKAFQKRVREFGNYLTKMFYGATIDYGFGTYKLKNKVISENVAVISIFTTKELYNKYDLELRKILLKKKQSWGQDSMGFEYQEKLIFI
jgi:hypothetical protein